MSVISFPSLSYEIDLYRIALRSSLCCTIHSLAVFLSWWLLSSSGVFGLYFLCSLFRPSPLRASVSFATSGKLGRSIPLPCVRVFSYAVRKCVQLLQGYRFWLPPLSDRVRLWGLRVSPSKTFLYLYIQIRCLLFRSEYFRMWTLLYITSEKRKLWKYLREPPSFL